MRPIFKTSIKVAILLGVLAYFIFALTTFNRPVQEPACKGLDIVVNDEKNTNFINENEIRELLVKKKLFPEGRAIADIDLAELESVLVASPYIDKALCYTTSDDRVMLQVTPRVPVLHVLNVAGEDFYIDNCGGTMPRGHHVIDLIVMTGHVQRTTAGPLYSPMACVISSDPYWRDQIQEIHVDVTGDLSLTPRVGQHVILLGDTSKIADKLERMRIFQTEGLDKAGWNKYKTISLKYDNQVIATRKQEP
ncbi:MAG: hypothetical protein K6A32_01270 [Bacteroidales bacterium]|nr:hypothetical protein [Bacteroidales bacterium]